MIDMLDRLLTEYNINFHRTIGMTPSKSNQIKNHKMITHHKHRILGKPEFRVGDEVRISRIKGIFEKGYLPNWSELLKLSM